MATSTAPAARHQGQSSILLKTVMAVTGVLFVLFVLAHMYGNLLIFGGEEAFNEYAEHLRTLGEPILPYSAFLWVVRVGLILSLVLHAWSAFALWSRAGKARTTRYAVSRRTYGSFYIKAMRWGGVAILLFVVFHILHFTTHTINIGGAQSTPADRVIASFDQWWAVLIYGLAMLALGLHLLHGVFGAAMTLGLNTSLRAAGRIRAVATGVAVVVVVGFMVPPLAILFGLVP